MKQIFHIILAAGLAAFCVFPATGQSYKKNKVKTDPEPLEFRKVYWIPEKEKDDLYRDMAKWESGLDLVFINGAGYDERYYFLQAYDLDFGKQKGGMTSAVNLHFFMVK